MSNEQVHALYATPSGERVEDKYSRAAPLSAIEGWRPIETAPKEDRKRILVIQDTPGDFEGIFTGAHWVEYRGSQDGGFWQADLGGLWPTRWMPAPSPIPAPPAQAETEGGAA